ncbi:MAG: 4-(cytidine 5'-diphospho)-2-C-methyl-D-erythritol kinase [Thermotogota bacterium]
MPDMTIDLLAYAKLNLSLRVRGRRPDGYHEIDSIVQTIDLADRLRIHVAEGDGLRVTNDLPGLEGPDLAARAATAALATKDARRDITIDVRKGIPAGAGLGGGSSDAAAVLRSLDLVVPPVLPGHQLHDVAAQLGSDVPLFLVGGCVRIRGRGEQLESCPELRTETFTVLVPPIHCATPVVYATWHAHPASTDAPCALGANDLLAPALATHPALLPYDRAIRGLGGHYAGMSGSGSAFYAAFVESSEARCAADVLERMFPEARVFLCRPTPSASRRVNEGRTT